MPVRREVFLHLGSIIRNNQVLSYVIFRKRQRGFLAPPIQTTFKAIIGVKYSIGPIRIEHLSLANMVVLQETLG